VEKEPPRIGNILNPRNGRQPRNLPTDVRWLRFSCAARSPKRRLTGRTRGCRRLLDVLVSLEEIDAAPEDPERVTPEALARMQRSIDTLRGYIRRVDLFKEHAGAAFL